MFTLEFSRGLYWTVQWTGFGPRAASCSVTALCFYCPDHSLWTHHSGFSSTVSSEIAAQTANLHTAKNMNTLQRHTSNDWVFFFKLLMLCCSSEKLWGHHTDSLTWAVKRLMGESTFRSVFWNTRFCQSLTSHPAEAGALCSFYRGIHWLIAPHTHSQAHEHTGLRRQESACRNVVKHNEIWNLGWNNFCSIQDGFFSSTLKAAVRAQVTVLVLFLTSQHSNALWWKVRMK